MLRANVIAWRPFALGLTLVASTACSAGAGEFKSNWGRTSDRVWIGPDWWANRAGDWRIHDGRLECVQPGVRAAYLATRTLGGSFQLSVRTGMAGKHDTFDKRGFTGFFFFNMGKDDYKTEDLSRSFISLKTLLAGLDGEGRLFVYFVRDATMVSRNRLARHENEDIRLELRAVPVGKGYSLEFAAFDHKTGKLLDRLPLDGDGEYPADLPRPADGEFPAEPLNGYVALVAGTPPTTEGGKPRKAVRYWYRDFKLSGKDVETHAERPEPLREHTEQVGESEASTIEQPPADKSAVLLDSLAKLKLASEQESKIRARFADRENQNPPSPATFAEFLREILDEEQQAVFDRLIESPDFLAEESRHRAPGTYEVTGLTAASRDRGPALSS